MTLTPRQLNDLDRAQSAELNRHLDDLEDDSTDEDREAAQNAADDWGDHLRDCERDDRLTGDR